MLGSFQVRNVVTIGGLVCCMSEKIDIIPLLVALQASVQVIVPSGTPYDKVSVLLQSLPETLKRPGAVMVSLRLPVNGPASVNRLVG